MERLLPRLFLYLFTFIRSLIPWQDEIHYDHRQKNYGTTASGKDSYDDVREDTEHFGFLCKAESHAGGGAVMAMLR